MQILLEWKHFAARDNFCVVNIRKAREIAVAIESLSSFDFNFCGRDRVKFAAHIRAASAAGIHAARLLANANAYQLFLSRRR